MYNKSVEEIIRERHSVRNFTSESVPEEVLLRIKSFIEKVDNPFKGDVSISLIKKDDFKSNMSFGTYGMIKGEKYYLAAFCGDDVNDSLSLGYMLEKVVLYCTDLGLGSVWLGGTFKRDDFEQVLKIPENQKLRIVVPFGYEGGRKSVLASFIGSNKNKRKDFSEIFFEGNFEKKLVKEKADKYLLALEMVRLAPSGVNVQPWRLIKRGSDIDFYSAGEGLMSMIDMGIAIAHFKMVIDEQKISGDFREKENMKEEKYSYIISFCS